MIENLKLHLCKDVAIIVYNYFGIIEEMWAEQNISVSERTHIDFLLGRLKMPLHSDDLQIQPWFIGQGASLIRLLICLHFDSEKIHMLPRSNNIESFFPFGHFPYETDLKDHVYILNSSQNIMENMANINVWLNGVTEQRTVIHRAYQEGTWQHIPRGIGIFENESDAPDFTDIIPNFRRRTHTFYLEKQISHVNNTSIQQEIEQYWDNTIKIKL